MRDRRMSKVPLLVVAGISAACIVIAFEASRMSRAGNAPQTPAELWLSWSSDTRAWYVGGYVAGFREGERAGCSFYADKIAPYMPNEPAPVEKLPKVACLDALPDFVKPTQAYVHAITSYYTKYPNDRQAGMPRILFESASPPGLTIDQIHAKLTAGPKD